MGLSNYRLLPFKNVNRIVLKDKTYQQLLITPEELYEILSNFILDNENLFFYCTQKSSCRTIEDTRKYVKKLISMNIIKDQVNDVLITMGWDKDNIDINNAVFSGDLGEYLMNIIISKFSKASSLISKVSLKTSPKMPAHGNDNIFYDYEKEILYYGESKFYSSTSRALKEANDSINLHLSDNREFAFIKTHTGSFVAENGELLKKIENEIDFKKTSDVTIKSISFVMSDDKYEEEDYSKLLNTMIKNGTLDSKYVNESIIIFLPVISKDDFLKYFERRVKSIC